MRELTYLQIVILKILWDNRNTTVQQHDLINFNSDSRGLVNEFLSEHNITADKTIPIKSVSNVSESMGLLRELGFITGKGYKPEPSIGALFKQIGSDPHKWPISIPVEDGELRFDKAYYGLETGKLRLVMQ